MAKLPKDFTEADIRGKTYTYQDALEMLDDVRRAIRKTGWSAISADIPATPKADGVPPKPAYRGFMLVDPNADESVSFRMQDEAVRRTLWPNMYPSVPNIEEIKRGLTTTVGRWKLIAELNSIEKQAEPQPTTSRWSRLTNDDD